MASAAPHVPADGEFERERYPSLLQTCVSDDGDIYVDTYMAGIEELSKILKRFAEDNLGFILDEVRVNLSLLKDHREGHSGEHYCTVQGMIDHELCNSLIHSDNRPSGSHTVLWLHRTMEFFHNSFEKLQDLTLSDEEIPGEIAKVYTETLGRFHPELMMASIQWALPTFILSRASLGERMGFTEDPAEFWIWVRRVTDNLKRMNDTVHTIYERHQILNLPEDDKESDSCS